MVAEAGPEFIGGSSGNPYTDFSSLGGGTLPGFGAGTTGVDPNPDPEQVFAPPGLPVPLEVLTGTARAGKSATGGFIGIAGAIAAIFTKKVIDELEAQQNAEIDAQIEATEAMFENKRRRRNRDKALQKISLPPAPQLPEQPEIVIAVPRQLPLPPTAPARIPAEIPTRPSPGTFPGTQPATIPDPSPGPIQRPGPIATPGPVDLPGIPTGDPRPVADPVFVPEPFEVPHPLHSPFPNPFEIPQPDPFQLLEPQPFQQPRAAPFSQPLTPPQSDTLDSPRSLLEPQPQPQPRQTDNCPPCTRQKAKEDEDTPRDACYKMLVKQGLTPKLDSEYEWAEIDCLTGREL